MYIQYLFCIWPLLNYVLDCDMFTGITMSNIRLKNNTISAFHTTISNIMNVLYFTTYSTPLLQFSSMFSISYFIWDTYRISLCQVSEYLFILHHIIAVNILRHIYMGSHSNMLLFTVLIAELSNIPYFIVYYMAKINKLTIPDKYYPDSIVNYYKNIQLYVFFIIRILAFTYLAICHIPYVDDIVLIIELYIIYFIGAWWFFQQFKGIRKGLSVKEA